MFENLKWKLVERPILPIGNTYLDAFVFLVFFGLLFFAGIALKNKRGIGLRPFVQAVTFVFFIFIVHRCFCALRGTIFSFQDIGKNDLNVFNGLFILVPLIAFTLLFGRIFCAWLCPLGFMQEVFFRVPFIKRIILDPAPRIKRLRLLLLVAIFFAAVFLLLEFRPKTFFFVQNIASFWGLATIILAGLFVLNPGADLKLKKLRYFLLFIWLFIIFLGIFVTDPWCALYGNEIDYSSLVGLFAVLATAAIVPMAWCRYLCPLGSSLSLMAKFFQIKIKVKKDSVISKIEARQICYVQALEEKALDKSSCLFCKRCVEAGASEIEEL
ncbi:MAG: 4Fe-4S binding protein [Candidatus Omnitrophica bacterium]|nr:4Fe-4S binding protein [Candidatus Omnitrophota bacterium]MBU1923976.1 4Fe-4S binding protein [Candidatus Omnitrophota bacterium]